MTRFDGAGELEEAAELGCEQTPEALLRADDTTIESLFFHVGSRKNGFVVRPEEFERASWRSDGQPVVDLGHCAIHLLVSGELGRALER